MNPRVFPSETLDHLDIWSLVVMSTMLVGAGVMAGLTRNPLVGLGLFSGLALGGAVASWRLKRARRRQAVIDRLLQTRQGLGDYASTPGPAAAGGVGQLGQMAAQHHLALQQQQYAAHQKAQMQQLAQMYNQQQQQQQQQQVPLWVAAGLPARPPKETP